MSEVEDDDGATPVLGALVVLLAACSSADGSRSRGPPRARPTTVAAPSTSTSSTTTTALEAPTATTEAAAPRRRRTVVELGRRPGPAGAAGRAGLRRRARPTGGAGGRTSYSIMAFQKVEGLDRTGDIDAETPGRPGHGQSPPGRWSGGAVTRVEIDLNRQVLFLLERRLPRPDPADLHRQRRALLRRRGVRRRRHARRARSGSAARPPGLEVAPLGELWWPMYFNGGHRHPRVAVGARLPGVPRVHPHPHVRGADLLRPGRTGVRPSSWWAEAPGPKGPAAPPGAAAEPGDRRRPCPPETTPTATTDPDDDHHRAALRPTRPPSSTPTTIVWPFD